MAWQASDRNRAGIAFRELRLRMDPLFEDLNDGLSDAYYNYWVDGVSHPWYFWDVMPTKEQTYYLYLTLCSFLSNLYDLAFHRCNLQLAKPFPEESYNFVFDRDGNFAYRKSEKAFYAIQEMMVKRLADSDSYQATLWFNEMFSKRGFKDIMQGF